MHPAVATLQQAARRLQHSGNMDASKYAWMMSQLRGVTAELDASERKARNQKTDPVDITELLREVLAKLERHSRSSWPFNRPTSRIFSVGNCGRRRACGVEKFPSLPNWIVAGSDSVSQSNVGWLPTAKR
jgi:hypothetical protein